MSIVVNTTVISNFAAIYQLELLRHVFGTLHLTAEVYEEILAGFDEGYSFYAGIEGHIYPFTDSG